MGTVRFEMELNEHKDLYEVRGEVLRLCRDLGFSKFEQVQIATAVSEVVRNALLYAGGGRVIARGEPNEFLRIEVRDNGPGIDFETLEAIENGTYVSKTGLGKGIAGAKKLMTTFEMMSNPGLTQVWMTKRVGR